MWTWLAGLPSCFTKLSSVRKSTVSGRWTRKNRRSLRVLHGVRPGQWRVSLEIASNELRSIHSDREIHSRLGNAAFAADGVEQIGHALFPDRRSPAMAARVQPQQQLVRNQHAARYPHISVRSERLPFRLGAGSDWCNLRRRRLISWSLAWIRFTTAYSLSTELSHGNACLR